MSNLNDTRKKINAIDKEMAKLFVERMKASKEVAEYKMEYGLPIYDKIREEEVIKNNTELIEEDELKKYVNDFKNPKEFLKHFEKYCGLSNCNISEICVML